MVMLVTAAMDEQHVALDVDYMSNILRGRCRHLQSATGVHSAQNTRFCWPTEMQELSFVLTIPGRQMWCFCEYVGLAI